MYTSWQAVFKDARFSYCSGTDGGKAEVLRRMALWGDGAVAQVKVQWDASNAHVFIAEQVNGIVRFVDPQTGNINCESYFTRALNNATMISRVDNLEPTALIEKCIKNRGGKS